MAHKYSHKGIVGLGALGRAIDTMIPEPESQGPGVVFFCVKAFDLEAALLEHQSLWPAKTPFVTLTNGFIWPLVSRNQKIFGIRPIRIGMTTIGSTITENDTVNVYSANSLTAWGNWGENLQQPCLDAEMNLLTNSFPNGSWHNDIRPVIRKKWIINVVINSLTASYRLSKNSLLKNYEADVHQTLAEALHLADRLWPNLEIPMDHDEILKQIWQVVESTSANENSMAKDVRLGRKTESEFLAGISLNFDGFPKLKSLHQKITQNNIEANPKSSN